MTTMEDNNMERNYKVFISYRHLPLDMKVAAKLQTTIEHYTIPKIYRKGGEKKLGIVFRDKNELPITNDLSSNLRNALDHSEYLVVICSPETRQSKWVLEEVSYFLEHHDRDHVMVFLVDGTMDESVPEQLLGITDENGNLIRRTEPLAANIVSENPLERERIFRVEVLRILATLIGCPFDALYRRNLRYMRHKMMLVCSLILVVALGFIGMLWNRNNLIQEQFEQTQIQESELLISLSDLEEKDGNYTQAVKDALDALPDNDDRPYVSVAELTLSNLMYLYSDQEFQYQYSLGVDESVSSWIASSDGKYIVTKNISGTTSVYSSDSREMLYSFDDDENTIIDMNISPDNEKLIIIKNDRTIAKNIDNGKICWEKAFFSEDSEVVLSNPSGFFLSKDSDDHLRLYKDEDASLYKECTFKCEKDNCLSYDFYLSSDQSFLCFYIMEGDNNIAYLWDLTKNKIYTVDKFNYENVNFLNCTFTEDHRLLIAGENEDHAVFINCYKLQKGKIKKLAEKSFQNLNSTNVQKDIGNDCIQFFECDENMIAIANRNALILFDSEDLSTINSTVFSDYILDAKILDNDQVAVVTKKGEINLFGKSGLSSEQNINYFNTNYYLNSGKILGNSLKDLNVLAQSEEYYEQITSIQWKENERAIWADTVPDKEEKMLYFSSPNEKYSCLIREAWDKDAIFVGTLWKSGKLVNHFLISKSCWKKTNDSDFVGDIRLSLLTNEGNLIVDGGISVDLKNNSATRLLKEQNDILSTFSYVDHAHNDAVTTLQFINGEQGGIEVWEDGVFQKKINIDSADFLLEVIGSTKDGKVYMQWMDYSDNKEVSYAIYVYNPEKKNLKQILPYKTEDYCDSICMTLADNNPYCALTMNNGDINIIDLSNGKTKSVIEGKYGKNALKMMFIDDDKYLMILSENGVLDILDAESGESVHHSNGNKLGKEWTMNINLEVSLDEKHNEIIIIADGINLTESICFVFNLSTFEMLGSYTEPVHFNQKNHTFVVNPRNSRLLEIPFYHTEDIIELAKNYLSE